jgi:hypothetical protein
MEHIDYTRTFAGFFTVFFAPRPRTTVTGSVGPVVPTVQVGLNEDPAPQYDLMVDLLHVDMFKVLWDMLRIESLRIHQDKSAKFGYLPMMTVTTLDALNPESFCVCVLSCVKLTVSDLHVSLKRVHGVHEGELPRHSIVGIQRS